MNSSKLIPDERSEVNVWVFVVILDIGKSLVLVDFIVFLLFIHLVITHVLVAVALHKLTLETLDHLVEVDTVRAKNGKFSVLGGAELGFFVVLRLARHLGLWFNVQFLVRFKIED